MNQPLRIGLIGAGMVSRHHLLAWASYIRSSPRRGGRRSLRENAARRASEFGIAQTYAGAEAMLAATELDAIDIAAPREMHAPLVRLAGQKRLPVLCQKPLAPNLQEAIELAAEVERSDAADGARELALSRLLPRRGGLAARGPHRQCQAGAAHAVDIGRAAGPGWTLPGAGAAALHAPGTPHAGRGSPDPSPRYAAHAARAAARDGGAALALQRSPRRRRRRSDPASRPKTARAFRSLQASPPMAIRPRRSTGWRFSATRAPSSSTDPR